MCCLLACPRREDLQDQTPPPPSESLPVVQKGPKKDHGGASYRSQAPTRTCDGVGRDLHYRNNSAGLHRAERYVKINNASYHRVLDAATRWTHTSTERWRTSPFPQLTLQRAVPRLLRQRRVAASLAGSLWSMIEFR